MKDHINRTKQIIRDHKTQIVTGIGAVSLGYVLGVTFIPTKHFLNVTQEQLQTLIDDPGLWLQYDLPLRQTVTLVPVPTP